MRFLHPLIFADNFLPHGFCYLWSPGLMTLHVVSDSLIAISYLSIPVTLVYFIRKRRDIPFSSIFLCSGAFIVACGATHAMEVWTIWVPSYWMAGAVKAFAAFASLSTAIVLIQVTPKALALPGTQWLVDLNEKLTAEVALRGRVETDLRHLSEELERRVTERTAELVAVNDSLRESELRYRTLVEHAPEAIVVLDVEQRRFVDINGNAEHLFGMSREDLLLAGPAEVSPPFQPDGRPSREAAATNIDQVLSGVIPRFEWVHRNSSGQEIPCEISLVQLSSSARKLARASIVDISERKRAQARILQLNFELEGRVAERTAQLELANRDLESFTYSVSHDLRAPLRHMDGFSRILMEDYGPQLPPGALRHLQRVREATLHMGNLVDDLLNLARVGRGTLSLRPTDLNELVAQVIAELESDAAGRVVEWRVASLPQVECDPGLMRQVFMNLLANALKFTSRKENAVIEIGQICENEETVIFVRDNGVGFDARYADKLFQVFQRLHREEDFKGTGVGLAIVQRILQKHGGSIRAESAPDHGATFFFTVRRPLPSFSIPVQTAGETHAS
jgi:PAS domain S-box-containing protein